MKPAQKMAVLTILVTGSVALHASAAEECYRSTECEADLVCINLSCAASEVPLAECAAEADCSYHEICDQGVCKPDGVMCANDYGQCVEASEWSTCECDSGMGMGGESGCDGDGCQIDVIPDDELYQMCDEEVDNLCEAPPDINEVCTEEQIASCTEWLSMYERFEETCVGNIVDIPIEDTDVTDVSDSDGDMDTEAEGEADCPVGLNGCPCTAAATCGSGLACVAGVCVFVDDTDGSADADADADADGDADADLDSMGTDNDATADSDGSAEAPASGGAQEYSPDASDIAECCEELTEIAADAEEQAAFEDFINCMTALDPDDCEGFESCEEAFGGVDDSGGDLEKDTDDIAVEPNDTDGNSASDADADADEDTGNAGDGNNDPTVGSEDTETAQEADTSGDTETAQEADTSGDTETAEAGDDTEKMGMDTKKSDSGGCSFVAPHDSENVMTLFKALF